MQYRRRLRLGSCFPDLVSAEGFPKVQGFIAHLREADASLFVAHQLDSELERKLFAHYLGYLRPEAEALRGRATRRMQRAKRNQWLNAVAGLWKIEDCIPWVWLATTESIVAGREITVKSLMDAVSRAKRDILQYVGRDALRHAYELLRMLEKDGWYVRYKGVLAQYDELWDALPFLANEPQRPLCFFNVWTDSGGRGEKLRSAFFWDARDDVIHLSEEALEWLLAQTEEAGTP